MHIFNFNGGGGTPYLPYPALGPMPSHVRHSGRHGGNSTIDDRHSLTGGALVNAPQMSQTYTRHINPNFPGEDGFNQLMPSYRAYDKIVAVYTQPGYGASAPWQDDQYPNEHRPLIGHQPLGWGQVNLYHQIELSRPPVNHVDYNLQQITTDAAMGG